MCAFHLLNNNKFKFTLPKKFFCVLCIQPICFIFKNIRFKFDETSVLHILNLNTTLGVHIAHIEVPSLRE